MPGDKVIVDRLDLSRVLELAVTGMACGYTSQHDRESYERLREVLSVKGEGK